MISPEQANSFLKSLEAELAASEEPVASAMQSIARTFPHYDWVGVYWLHGDMLQLGPYVGAATEHTRIAVGEGVCGTAIAENKNQVIDDVRNLSNYLACSLTCRAEIVVLLRKHGEVIGQIDADSNQIGAFDRSDEELLEKVAELLMQAS